MGQARVLIASMGIGGGHTALLDSFARTLQEEASGARLEPYTAEIHAGTVGGFYAACVKYCSRLQGWLYEAGDLPPAPWLIAHSMPHLSREARALVLDTKPHIIVSTHFLLSMQLARVKHALGMEAPVITAIPDYGPTTRAFFPRERTLQGDFVLVTSPDTWEDLIHTKGCSQDRVHLTGFLTREPFSRLGWRLSAAVDLRKERIALRREAKQLMPELSPLVPELPTVTFLGGSAWTLKTAPVIEALLSRTELSRRLNLVVVCGKDERFARRMRERARSARNLSVLGFVSGEQMAALGASADAPVLGSLAPASMQELLEVRSGPLLLYHFIPGAESPHPAFIERYGLGLYEPRTEAMVRSVLELTGLEPLGPRLASLVRGFCSAASGVRLESRRRARELPAFLRHVLYVSGQGAAQEVLHRAAAAP